MIANECSGTQTSSFRRAATARTRRSLRSGAVTRRRGEPNEPLWERYWGVRDLEIRNRLVLAYEPLVQQIVSRFRRGGRISEDLLQVGRLGLIAAIERFDPRHGSSFVTYAVPTIIGCIKHHLRDQSWLIKPPRRLRELGMRLRTLSAEVEVALGRPPTPADLAEAAGLSLEQVLEAMEVDHVPLFLSLDSSGVGDSGEMDFPVGEQIGTTPTCFAAVDLRETVAAALHHLPPRLQVVLHLRFFRELPQVEVARRLGISQMHVSRLEREAIRTLRTFFEE